jgi:hypothetical protein
MPDSVAGYYRVSQARDDMKGLRCKRTNVSATAGGKE